MEALRRQSPSFWLAATGTAAMLIGTIGPWMKVLGAGPPGAAGTGTTVMIVAFLAAPFLWQHT